MTEQATMVEAGHGVRPKGGGWFVVNMAESAWQASARFGRWCSFEGDTRFSQLGINVHVLEPGQPACMYHRESSQEDFLVLSGECLLIVEEEERLLRQWDFVHCAPGTAHVFVGRGTGPCAILMVGNRSGDKQLEYPVSAVAAKHGASVEAATNDPRQAYAGTVPPEPVRASWPPA